MGRGMTEETWGGMAGRKGSLEMRQGVAGDEGTIGRWTGGRRMRCLKIDGPNSMLQQLTTGLHLWREQGHQPHLRRGEGMAGKGGGGEGSMSTGLHL